MSSDIDFIKMEALSLEDGETTSVYCPSCDNAKPYPPSLSISRIAGGILYNCYRSSCSSRGFIGSLPSNLLDSKKKKKVFIPNIFKRLTYLLPYINVLKTKYGISKHEVETNRIRGITGYNGLVMPLFNYQGYQYGNTTKYFDKSLKAIHYLESDTSQLHWPKAVCLHNPKSLTTIILVEDVLSAIRVNRLATGVALLGTDLTTDKVKDILKRDFKHIIVALDPDAVAKALKMKERYGLFFNTFKVAHLTNDPKDLSHDQLKKELEL